MFYLILFFLSISGIPNINIELMRNEYHWDILSAALVPQRSIIDVNELDWKAVSHLKVIERAIGVSLVRYQGTFKTNTMPIVYMRVHVRNRRV